MSKTLVAYFSASGVTRKVAERLSNAIGADIFEIKPKKVYTDADLNWQDTKSRSSIEMKDKSCRPEIAEKISKMEQYDAVFVGFPVWWYREPSIIDTFMEEYNFAGKKVIPFATSGSSGIGDSGNNMKELAKAADVEEGKRFASNVTEEELKKWASRWM